MIKLSYLIPFSRCISIFNDSRSETSPPQTRLEHCTSSRHVGLSSAERARGVDDLGGKAIALRHPLVQRELDIYCEQNSPAITGLLLSTYRSVACTGAMSKIRDPARSCTDNRTHLTGPYKGVT